jgi:hypothetical protein
MNPVGISHIVSLRSALILSYRLKQGFASGRFPSGFQTKILSEFIIIIIMCATFPSHPISLICSPESYLVKSPNYETPHSAISSILLFFVSLRSRSFSSAQHCSQRKSRCVPPRPYTSSWRGSNS